MVVWARGVKAFRLSQAKNLKSEATELEIRGRDTRKMIFWANYPSARRCGAGLGAAALHYLSVSHFPDSRGLVEGCDAQQFLIHPKARCCSSSKESCGASLSCLKLWDSKTYKQAFLWFGKGGLSMKISRGEPREKEKTTCAEKDYQIPIKSSFVPSLCL